MRNTSLTFRFLTRNSSLGELCILHIQKLWEMLFREIVKKYTADLILLTKFKTIIGMKEKFVQNIEVPVSLMEILMQNQESFDSFFSLTFYLLRWFLGEFDFRSTFLSFLANQIKNSKVFLRMCFRMCFREYVSESICLLC